MDELKEVFIKLIVGLLTFTVGFFAIKAIIMFITYLWGLI